MQAGKRERPRQGQRAGYAKKGQTPQCGVVAIGGAAMAFSAGGDGGSGLLNRNHHWFHWLRVTAGVLSDRAGKQLTLGRTSAQH
jgi:hypothetical protein